MRRERVLYRRITPMSGRSAWAPSSREASQSAIASPSTSTLRSGTVSRFSGGGALEKSSRITFFGACCCWNGVKKSPPNQPPPPPRGCCRCGPPKLPKLLPKLKNCAEAGPAIPTNSAKATASAASGPGSVKARKKDFVFGMRLGRNGSLGNHYYSGIRPQAGRFLTINRASAAAVKIAGKSLLQGYFCGGERGFIAP